MSLRLGAGFSPPVVGWVCAEGEAWRAVVNRVVFYSGIPCYPDI